jgi:hypothetical protein
MLTTLVVAANLLCQAPALPAGTEVEYDKFHDITMLSLQLGEFTNEAGTHDLSVHTFHKGREPKAATMVMLQVARYGPHWEYLTYHDVVMMCGDDRLKLRKSSYRSEVDTKDPVDHCNEFFQLYLSPDELRAVLGRDRDLEVKIGTHDPVTLGANARGKILRFVKAVQSGAY